MQQMSSDRDEAETNTNASTAPSTPGLQNQDNLNKIFDALHLSPNTPGMDDIPPAHPTSFTHLLHPVLRTDLQAYDDFHSYFRCLGVQHHQAEQQVVHMVVSTSRAWATRQIRRNHIL
jgi:hypothetical protein